jgi:hypothetical protein
MLSAGAPACTSSPEAEAFVRFCYQRRRVGWPELYDEMCLVATRGLFRGMGHDALADIGVGFSLFETPRLAQLVIRIVSEEQAARRAARETILEARAVEAAREEAARAEAAREDRARAVDVALSGDAGTVAEAATAPDPAQQPDPTRPDPTRPEAARPPEPARPAEHGFMAGALRPLAVSVA